MEQSRPWELTVRTILRLSCDPEVSYHVHNSLPVESSPQPPALFLKDKFQYMRFQVLTAASMNMTAFCHIVACSLVEVYRGFRGAYCFHHRPDDGGRTHFWNVVSKTYYTDEQTHEHNFLHRSILCVHLRNDLIVACTIINEVFNAAVVFLGK
jgi:hypothetical protein